MFKNKLLKKILKNTIFKFLSFINMFIKKRNIILIYCNNKGLRDNNLYLYEALIKNNLNDKYDIYISMEKKELKKNKIFKGAKVITLQKAVFKFLKAKYVFYCFGQIPIKPSKKQFVLQMTHGLAFKKDGVLIEANKKVGSIKFYTKILTGSTELVDITSKMFGCEKEDVLVGAFPRLDGFNLEKTEEIILWTPTFRKSDYLGMEDSSTTKMLPIFDKNYVEINDLCKKNNLKIIAKLHPLQNLNDYEKIELSNFELLSDYDFLIKYGRLYEFMGKTIGLITDYSSTFLDYLNLNKPIAFTNDDIDPFSKSRGIIYGDEFFDFCYMLNNKNDFEKFLENVHVDEYRLKRSELNARINPTYEYKENSYNLLKKIGLIK